MLTSRITLANGTVIEFFSDFSQEALNLNPHGRVGFSVYPAGRQPFDRRGVKTRAQKQARKAQKKARQKKRR